MQTNKPKLSFQLNKIICFNPMHSRLLLAVSIHPCIHLSIYRDIALGFTACSAYTPLRMGMQIYIRALHPSFRFLSFFLRSMRRFIHIFVIVV